MTEAAAEAHVGRITYGRIEAGIKTDWPAWLAVMVEAGISHEDAVSSWVSAKPQNGKAAEAETVYDKALPHVLAAEKAIRDASPEPVIITSDRTTPMSGLVRVLTPPLIPAPTEAEWDGIAELAKQNKRASGKSDQFRHVPDGDKCGWHWMTVGYVRNGKPVKGGIEEYRGKCELPVKHVAEGENHKFDRTVPEPLQTAPASS